MNYRITKLKQLLLLLAVSIVGIDCWAADINIVTTTTDLAAITREIVRDTADVSSMASGMEDPHFLQAKPSFIVRARKADVWICIGMELEVGWEGPILKGSRNRRIQVGQPGHINVSTAVLKLDVPKGAVSRAEGDVHAEGNPHYWLDPLNGRMMADTIAARLSACYPKHAETFSQNLKTFKETLDQKAFGKALLQSVDGATLWSWVVADELMPQLRQRTLDGKLGGWFKQMLPCKGKSILTYHKSWIYFCHRFDLQVAGELEPKPGVPPSGKHLVKVCRTARDQQVKAILVEPFYNRKSADFVASRTDAAVLVCPNCATKQGDYLSVIDHLVNEVAGQLGE